MAERALFTLVLLTGLAVVGVGAMLAQEVLILDILGSRSGIPLNLTGVHCHLGDFLQYHSVVHSLGRALAPGEGAMAGADDTGGVQGLDAALGQFFDDDLAGVLLIVLVDLLGGEMTGTGP